MLVGWVEFAAADKPCVAGFISSLKTVLHERFAVELI